MSQEEKDTVIFTTPEDEANVVEEKEKAPLPPDLGEAVGPSGEIDWDCPCLQGMADGPCGDTFKAAFSCFVYSQAEEKGSDCIPQFEAMHDCFNKHADYYVTDEEASTDQAEGEQQQERTQEQEQQPQQEQEKDTASEQTEKRDSQEAKGSEEQTTTSAEKTESTSSS